MKNIKDNIDRETEQSDKHEMQLYVKKLVITTMFILLAALVVLCINNFSTVVEGFNYIVKILKPFIYGAAIAYLMTPFCNKLDKKFNKKSPEFDETDKPKVRYSSIIIVESIFILLLIVIILVIVPQSIKSITTIVSSLPEAMTKAQEAIDKFLSTHSSIKSALGDKLANIQETIVNTVKQTVSVNFDDIFSNAVSKATAIGLGASNGIFAIVLSIFMLANRRNFSVYCKKLLYIICGKRVTKEILNELVVADKMFSGFFLGKTVDSLIVGAICLVCMALLRMPYTVLVSIIVAITNIIPIVGPFLGAIPGAIIIFSASPIKALYFLIFIVILQQIDGHIIGPKCIGNATGLSTFWVLFSIVVFGKMFGLIGMLIGVPTQAVIFDIIDKLTTKLEQRRARLEEINNSGEEDSDSSEESNTAETKTTESTEPTEEVLDIATSKYQ
jgi:predicted PurR-regulated permease PerM